MDILVLADSDDKFDAMAASSAALAASGTVALELALDGAQVMQLAAAFGGIDYMTDRAREFIENWEVESYRQTVAS